MADELTVFVVTTSRHVLAVDVERRLVKIVHSFGGIYYGLAASRDGARLFVGTRNSYAGPVSKDDRSKETGSILVFDAALQPLDLLLPPFPLRDLHGMAATDDELLVCCSFDNMVARFGLATRDWSRWYPHPDPEHRDADTSHYNTIVAEDDCLFLVAHNWGASDLLLYDMGTLDLRRSTRLGLRAHDVWTENGRLHTLSSGEGLIRAEDRVLKRTNAFPRGYARVGAVRVVGLSARAFPDQRGEEDGAVRIFGPSWDPVADIGLPKVGMVNAIVAVFMRSDAFDRLPPFETRTVARPDFDPCVFETNKADACTDFYPNEWHAPESDGRWTAARVARVGLFTDGEHTTVVFTVSTFADAPVRILVEDIPVFDGLVETGNLRDITVVLPRTTPSQFVVSFVAETLSRPENGDRRRLGLKLYAIGLRPESVPVVRTPAA